MPPINVDLTGMKSHLTFSLDSKSLVKASPEIDSRSSLKSFKLVPLSEIMSFGTPLREENLMNALQNASEEASSTISK